MQSHFHFGTLSQSKFSLLFKFNLAGVGRGIFCQEFRPHQKFASEFTSDSSECFLFSLSRGQTSGARPHLPGQQSFPPHATSFQLEASSQGQLDQHAPSQPRRNAIIPERGVALHRGDTYQETVSFRKPPPCNYNREREGRREAGVTTPTKRSKSERKAEGQHSAQEGRLTLAFACLSVSLLAGL